MSNEKMMMTTMIMRMFSDELMVKQIDDENVEEYHIQLLYELCLLL
jgi:hypothetical protein